MSEDFKEDNIEQTIFDDRKISISSSESGEGKESTEIGKSKHIPVLMVIEGSNAGECFALTKRETIIGRLDKHTLSFPDGKMSRHHCKITFIPNSEEQIGFTAILEDLGSTNGTYVNGEIIKGGYVLKDGDKILVGSTVLGFFIKIREEIDLERRLLKLATRDPLTSLFNRTFFDPTLEYEFTRYKLYHCPLSLIMADLDNFKKVNDSYGHTFGDFVLKEVGVILKGVIRKNDVPVRYGGEEFAIILPETGSEEAVSVAVRMRQAIERYIFREGEAEVRITASFGVAFCNEKTLTPNRLIVDADHALYLAKNSGRNNVKLESEMPDQPTPEDYETQL